MCEAYELCTADVSTVADYDFELAVAIHIGNHLHATHGDGVLFVRNHTPRIVAVRVLWRLS